MVKILLACSAGMSTSLLVTRMEKYAKANNIDAEIMAVPFNTADQLMDKWDVLMLGPQVRHQLKYFQKKANGKMPIAMIDMRDYGTMNGEKVLNAALKLYNDFHNQ